jgi:hypothetical protein
MSDTERYIIPSENGALYQVKFPDIEEDYLFHILLWKDITFSFNEEAPDKSYFIKESVTHGIPIQNCEFREMEDMSGNEIIILGSMRVTDMPSIFVGMANIPTDKECREIIAKSKGDWKFLDAQLKENPLTK